MFHCVVDMQACINVLLKHVLSIVILTKKTQATDCTIYCLVILTVYLQVHNQTQLQSKMVDQLTEEQTATLKENFSILNRDDDGTITAKELNIFYRDVVGRNLTETELQDIINENDADGNGTIDFPEFLTLMTRKKEETDIEELHRGAFRQLDRDDNGFFSLSEFRHGMKISRIKFTDEQTVHEMMKLADIDGAGQVSYNEFVTILSSK